MFCCFSSKHKQIHITLQNSHNCFINIYLFKKTWPENWPNHLCLQMRPQGRFTCPKYSQVNTHTYTVLLVTVTLLFRSQSLMHQCQPQILNHFPLKNFNSSLFWEVCLQTSPVHLKSRPIPQLHKSHENALLDSLTLPSIDHCKVLQTCRLLRWTRGIVTPSQDVRIVSQSK